MRLCAACDHAFASDGWRCPACGHEPVAVAGFPAFAPEVGADEGFNPAVFAELARLEAGNFWFRARNKLIVWALRQYFPEARGMLEIGCGTGYVLAGVAAAHPLLDLAGSEIHSAGLAHAAARVPGTRLMQMDARHIPFVDEFDVVGAFDVLEHIPEDEAVLAQMHRALRPGGGILVSVPQHMFLWSQADVAACHVRRYSAAELVGKVERAGFGVTRVTSFVSLLLPLMMLSRLAKRNSGDVLAELRISGPLNRVLERVLDAERSLIRSGASLPVGGSLLLVAHKKEENR